MPRGRKRNQRNRSNTHRIPTPPGESQRSKAYENGKAFRYAYRIHGPQYPVTNLTQLPPGSTLS